LYHMPFSSCRAHRSTTTSIPSEGHTAGHWKQPPRGGSKKQHTAGLQEPRGPHMPCTTAEGGITPR
jgi:hypothetical protein